jgi:FixJ family two-component response regulator
MNRPIALVLDDEPAVAELVATLAHMSGYEPVWFTSATEAIAEYRAGFAAVLITDESMPEMSGSAFIATVRRTDPDIPAILISGHILEKPASDRTVLLIKPFGIWELQDALHKATGSSRDEGQVQSEKRPA